MMCGSGLGGSRRVVACALGLLVASCTTWAGSLQPAAASNCSNEAVREGQVREGQPLGLALPDCRAYEQVSPVKKNDEDAEGNPGNVQSSPDGETVRFFSIAPFPEAVCAPPGGGKPTYIGSRDGAGAWSSTDVLACESPVTHATGFDTSMTGFSEDLSEAVAWAEGAPLSSDGPSSERGYYVRSTATGAYRLVVTATGAVEEKGYFELAGFSSDASHLVFESEEQLLPEATVGVPNVYEVDLNAPEPLILSLVGVVPPAGEASCGGSGPACEVPGGGAIAGAGATPWPSLKAPAEHFTNSSISKDGSRVFFTAEPSERIYVRESDQSTHVVSSGAAHFWAATRDGRFAFYSEGTELKRLDTQTDTRVTLTGAEGLFGVLGVSDDGSTAYFTSAGALAGNKNDQGEEAVSDSEIANLYEWHKSSGGEAHLTFIAGLLSAGPPGDEGNWRDHLGNVFPRDYKTSQVAPGGGTLLFTSHRELTGQSNGNCVKGCQELYRYRAGAEGAAGSLLCVSCSPSSVAPIGDALLGGQGRGSAQEAPHAETTLSRNLSANGERVFFETPDALVTGDENTGENPSCVASGNKPPTGCDVYEWEAEGEGSCSSETQDGGCLYLISTGKSSEQSFLLDTSVDGRDVFFFTREALLDSDGDGSVDVYDARVDGGRPVGQLCPTGTQLNAATGACVEAPCFSGDACRSRPIEAPGEATPGSVGLAGAGNLVPQKASPKPSTRAKKLAAALKACRKHRHRRKRVLCEKSARRKYGPVRKSGKR